MPKPYLIQAANSSLCRVVYANGTISDMVNLTRAKDILAKLEEDKNVQRGQCKLRCRSV